MFGDSFFAFLIVTPKPITKVVFDESHGDWETTVKTFSPSDFGRKHTYTYGLFAGYAKKTVGEMDRHFEGVPNFDNNTVFVEEVENEGQSNVVQVAGRMGEFAHKYNVQTIYIDETGLGGGLVDLGRENGLPVRGVVFSLQEKAEMYKNLRLLFENHKIKQTPTIGIKV